MIQTKPHLRTVANSGYGRTRTLYQVYEEFVDGRIAQRVLFEKMRHVPHASLQLVLHGVTILRNEREPFADTLDSIVNTLRFDLRGTRALKAVTTANGAEWSIGCVDDWPSTVSFTVYLPGATIGPTCAGSRPQCVTGRVS